MTPHFYFKPCNGKEPEGKEGDALNILWKNRPSVIEYAYNSWHCTNLALTIKPSDWQHIEVLTPVEGVVMTREQVDNLIDDAREYIERRGNLEWDYSKEYIINNLFK